MENEIKAYDNSMHGLQHKGAKLSLTKTLRTKGAFTTGTTPSPDQSHKLFVVFRAADSVWEAVPNLGGLETEAFPTV